MSFPRRRMQESIACLLCSVTGVNYSLHILRTQSKLCFWAILSSPEMCCKQIKICKILWSIRCYFALITLAVVFHLNFVEKIVLLDEPGYQAELT